MESTFPNNKIAAIVVTYHPVVENVRSLVNILSDSCQYCIIVDNTPSDDNKELNALENEFKIVKIISLRKNIGIAAAQNVGIEYVINVCEYFIFFDQDSTPDKIMIQELFQGFNKLSEAGYTVGAVGPTVINRKTGNAYIGRVKTGKSLTDYCDIREVSELISSGTFFNAATWRAIGKMEEALFIDGVDHEWCWRGTHLSKFRYFIIDKAILYHALGEGDVKILNVFSIKVPKPMRCFYQYRNYLWLMRRAYVPMYWKVSNGVKYFLKCLIYPFFLKPGRLYLNNIVRGIKAGVKFKI